MKDWNALKLFLAIAERGSLAQAALELDVNHSTVFRRLNSLEEDLGGRLFERFPSGYQLTPLGEELLDRARSIAAGFDELDRTIVGKDIQPKGLITITAPNNLAYRFLPAYLASFQQQYPDIRTDVLVSNLQFNMDSRQADIALRATPSPPPHLVGRKLLDIHWSVYSSPTYAARFGNPPTVDDLGEHRIIGGSGNMRSLPAFIWLEQQLPHALVGSCDDLVAMSYCLEAGQGLAVLPDDQWRPGLDRLFAFEPAGASQLWLLTHPDLRRVTRIQLLMRHFAENFEMRLPD